MDIAFPKNNERSFLKISELLDKEIMFAYKQKENYKLGNIIISNKGERKNFESNKIKMFFDLENLQERDFIHQRNSGLNHILAKIAHDKDKVIGFNFSSVLNASPEKRVLLLGRMRQNVKLCRKYKVKMFIASFASEPYEIRSNYELRAFGYVIGMNPKEVKESLTI